MKLIIGLGNPGKPYEKTRHNTGFMALDLLRADLNAPEFKLNEKFNAETAITNELILAKHQTFMNESGKAVRTLADYYKIGVNDILVIYDDLDLPLGAIRIGRFESSGGHKGVQSIIDYLKSSDFIRFRVGIKNDKANKQPVEKFVLQKFGLLEKSKINNSLNKTVEAIKLALIEPLDKVMNQFN